MYQAGNICMDGYRKLALRRLCEIDLIIHNCSIVTSHTPDLSKRVHIGITGKCYKKLAEPAETKKIL